MNRNYSSIGTALALLLLAPALSHAQTLRGSPATVDLMYTQAVQHRLEFFESAGAIRNAHGRGELLRLDGDANYTLAGVSYPYALPEVHTFVTRLAAQYRAACGEKLVVTSATRPTSMRLANSVDKSVHPTGMAIDLRKPRNSRCLSWLRSTLLSLDSSGLVEAVEERYPPHFHVAIFPQPYSRYVQARTGGEESQLVAAVRPVTSTNSTEPAMYEVRNGDSLWTISRRFNVSVQGLQAANSMRGSRIIPGQTLVIPGAGAPTLPREYEVRRGDSLWTIARQNNLTVDHLRAANDIRGSRIVAGQVLVIPSTR